MTRKRFIKLLMSHGAHRDIARKFAGLVVQDNIHAGVLNHFSKAIGCPFRYEAYLYKALFADVMNGFERLAREDCPGEIMPDSE